MDEKRMTGYPSIDKPWMSFYDKDAVSAPLPDTSIYEYIYSKNRNYPDDVAIRYFGRKVSFKKLFSTIESLSNAFVSAGVKPNDVVAVCLPAVPEAVYIIYALNRIGAVPNMLDPRYNESLLEFCLREAPCSLLLTYDGCYNKFLSISEDVLPKRIVAISALVSAPPALRVFASVKQRKVVLQSSEHMLWNTFIKKADKTAKPYTGWKRNDCCIILHTGGTTGNPKGVMLSNYSINSIAHQYNMLVTPKRGESLLDIIPPFASYGVCTSMHMPLSFGLSVEMIPNFEPDRFGDLLAKYKPNYVMGVPSFYESMLSNKRLKNADMSYLYSAACGGDSVSISIEKKINDFLEQRRSPAHIDMGYGMSEMSATACICVSFEGIYSPGSIGIPFAHTVFKIVDPESTEECKYNESGEICISGPGMMLGYLNNPELTEKTIRRHSDGLKWVHTGDLGHISEEGFLFHDGRIKRMIVRYDGFKLYPSAVEQAILKHPAVQSCAVVKFSKKGLGAMPKAYIILKNKTKPTDMILEEILKYCHEDLAERSVPQDFEFVEQFPLTSMGKIDYRALEKQAEEMSNS